MDRTTPPSPASERRLRARRLRRGWDAFYGMLRFVARHVQGVYSAYAAFLSIAFVGTAALVAFVGIAKVVLEGFLQPWDDLALRWLAGHRTPVLTTLAQQATALGSGVVLVVVVVVGSAFLWLTRHRHSAYLLLASFFGAWLLNMLLKDVFERPRPLVVTHLASAASSSFPSGHAMSSMAAYGAIALLVTRLEESQRARLLTWVLAAALVIVIGASRVYLGVHYPSDVLGGYAAGLAWVAFAAAGMSALRYFGRQEPDIAVQERGLERPEVRV
ncbi:MAG TPA: phosphatase PAP2 family protein [Longimicrobiales bacterium]